MSTSVSRPIAVKFAVTQANFMRDAPKVIFEIDRRGMHAIDISWISPFPTEQELLLKGTGILRFCPKSFRSHNIKGNFLIVEMGQILFTVDFREI